MKGKIDKDEINDTDKVNISSASDNNQDNIENNTLEDENKKDIDLKGTIQLGINPLIDGKGAKVNGTNIEISEGGIYQVAGSLLDGMITINTEEDVVLNLNQVSIISNKEALNIIKAKSVTLNLEEGTINYFESNNVNDLALNAINSNCKMNIAGSGTIIIYGINNLDGLDVSDSTLILLGNSAGSLNKIRSNDVIINSSLVIPGHTNLAVMDDQTEVASFISSKDIRSVLVSFPEEKEMNINLYKGIVHSGNLVGNVYVEGNVSSGEIVK